MFRQYRLFHRIFRLCRPPLLKTTNYRKLKEIAKLNTLIGVQVCCSIYKPMINEEIEEVNLEDDITKALQEGDAAIIKLMNQLKEFVMIVSEEYRKCIVKQIEIMERASDLGPFSEMWDELPQYRTLATELQKELTEYFTLFKTLDALARNRIQEVTNNELDVVKTFREIQNFIQKEVDENRRMEKELLKAVTDSIVNEALQETSNSQ